MIQHENNLKSLPSEQIIVRNVVTIEQGLTESIFTIAPNVNRVKVSIQNIGENDINIFINNQRIAIIAKDICQFLSDGESKLSIGLSSPFGSLALIASYLSV